jgi:hypothetical protein
MITRIASVIRPKVSIRKSCKYSEVLWAGMLTGGVSPLLARLTAGAGPPPAPAQLLAASSQCVPECRFMAHLLITDDAVTIDMSRGEKLETGHRNQTFPRSAISGVRAVPDCIDEVHGMKGVGVQLPDTRMGSWHDHGRVTFAVCHGRGPGIVIDLEAYAKPGGGSGASGSNPASGPAAA